MLAEETKEINSAAINYSEVVESSQFQHLLKEKKRFILPWTAFFLTYFLALPVLTAFTSVLNTKAIGSITWAWVFGFTQFIMTWVLCSVYGKKAATFDHHVESIKREMKGENA